MPTSMKAKELRKAAGVSLIQAAVAAGVAEGTYRVFEANPDAVSPEKRAKCEAFCAKLARRSTSRPSTPPPVACEWRAP